jgi:hypothetical protein
MGGWNCGLHHKLRRIFTGLAQEKRGRVARNHGRNDLANDAILAKNLAQAMADYPCAETATP